MTKPAPIVELLARALDSNAFDEHRVPQMGCHRSNNFQERRKKALRKAQAALECLEPLLRQCESTIQAYRMGSSVKHPQIHQNGEATLTAIREALGETKC
ncbi:MAG: hypothetical protein KGL39_39950 [Patescibacteria group bacterium]|nr:hypothetical protein [Patescibacteria group bacterium]